MKFVTDLLLEQLGQIEEIKMAAHRELMAKLDALPKGRKIKQKDVDEFNFVWAECEAARVDLINN